MRRVVLVLLGIAAVVAISGSLASAVSPKRCGTRYTQRCRPPHLHIGHVKKTCHKIPSSFTLPKITGSSNAGIRKIKIRRDHNKHFKTFRYKGQGPTNVALKHVRAHTKHWHAGKHRFVVTLYDIRGKKVSGHFSESVCRRHRHHHHHHG